MGFWPVIVSCFINRQLIYNYPEQLFADAKVAAIEHADFEGIERLVRLQFCVSLSLSLFVRFVGQIIG
jgi:hypothetical protein